MKNGTACRAEVAVAAVLPRSATERCYHAKIWRTTPPASERPPRRAAAITPRWTSARHSAIIPISARFITSELRHISGHVHRPHRSPRECLDTHRSSCERQETMCIVGRLVVTHEGSLDELPQAELTGPGCSESLPLRQDSASNNPTRSPVPSEIPVTAAYSSEARPPCAPNCPVNDRLVPSTRVPPGGTLPENFSGNKPVNLEFDL